MQQGAGGARGVTADTTAYQAVALLVAVVRIPLAGWVTLLLGSALPPTRWPTALALAMVVGLAATAMLTAQQIRRLRYDQLPGRWSLALGGLLDVLWVTGGYVVTGLAFFPFPALLVVQIGAHGLLLPPRTTVGLTLLASLLVGGLQLVAVPLGGVPLLGTDLQLMFLLGLGTLSALVGNRMRAAGAVVARLGETTQRLAAGQLEIVSHLPVGIVLLDGEGRVVHEAGEPWSSGVQGPGAGTLVAALRVADERFAGAIGGEETVQGETALGLDGGERWMGWTVAHRDLPDVDRLALSVFSSTEAANREPPTVRRTVILLQDRTDARQAEALRGTLERTESIAALSSALAHEIRNPLAALTSACGQLLDPGTILDDDDRQLLGAAIRREADRVNRLVTDFLEFARLGRERGPGVADAWASTVVAEAADTVRRAIAGARIEVAVSGPDRRVEGVRLGQIMGNLLTNAVQHTRRGTVVRVDVTHDSTGWVARVRDHGPGIPGERREAVFRPFVTGRAGGTGLGLPIARQAAAVLGGTVTVETPPGGAEVGEGSVLVVRLPAVAG